MATTTFLFVDQVASTEQLARLGDETAQQVRRTLFDLLRESTQVHRGREVDFTGDGLFCAFEGAADAVDAAVAMQQEAASISERQAGDHAVSVRIGLHTGEPLRNEDGGYFGSAVVVAARLCSRANGGQILVSSLVRGLVDSRGRHRFVPEGALHLKGIPEPVEAFTVAWEPAPHRAALPAQLSGARSGPFVGRTQEMGTILSAWQGLTDSGGRRLVLISGDTGSGMTRLMAEAAETVRRSGAAVWAGVGQGRESRLVAWAEAIDGWARAMPRPELRLAVGDKGADLLRLVPGLAELLPGLPSPASIDAEASVFLIADAVDALVEQSSGSEPLLICLDRLHDADPASLTVLRRLLHSRRGGRVLVLGTYEPSAVGASRVVAALTGIPDVVDLRLHGLTEAEVRELLTAVGGAPASDAAVRAILAESEGSPYYVRRMARSARETGLTRRVGDAVGRAVDLRTDLRLQREEIALGLRQLDQLRDEMSTDMASTVDPDGTPPVPAANPYRGLLPYTADDAEAFFGREALVAEMIAALAVSRWLAVVGPSGSGKSSAVRAGLLSALRTGALPGSDGWVQADVRPGTDPLAGLGAVVAELSGTDDGADVAGELRSAPLSDVVGRSLGGRRLVLDVDQFAELWTSSPDEPRARMLDLLAEAALDPGEAVSVVVTMRADYYGRTAEHPALAGLMADSQVLVPTMTPAELRAAVEMPARRAGLTLEPGLAQAVLDDVAGQPGALPLLSTAMRETWERRRGRSLTLAGYAESGGARRAIAHLADATFDEFDAGEQEVARRMLLRLAAPAADGGDVARPAPLSELVVDDATSRVLDRLTERRLVTANETSAQPAHEALLREWPRLRTWLDADREGRRLHQQVATAAAEWENAGKEDDSLLRGVRLAAADDWRADHEDALSGREKEFLDASVALRERDLRKARRTTRRFQALAAVLVLLLVGAGVATVFAVNSSRTASQRATEAIARDLVNQTRLLADAQLDTALLLAVEGYRRVPSLETQGGLLTALDAARHLTGFRRELPAGVISSALSGDGRTLGTLTIAGELQVFDTSDWTQPPATAVSGIAVPLGMALSPDGRHAVYQNGDGAHLVDLAGGTPGPPLPSDSGFPAFSPDGRLIVLVQGTDVVLVDVSSGAVGRRIPVADTPTVAVRPGAQEMAVTWGGFENAAQMQRLDLDGNPLGPPVDVPGDSINDWQYTADGRHLLIVASDGSVRLLHADSLLPAGRAFASGSAEQIFTAQLSPRGDTVALGYLDGGVELAGVDAEEGIFPGLRIGPVAGGVPTFHWLDDQRFLRISTSQAAEFDLSVPTAIGGSVTAPVESFAAADPEGQHLFILADGHLREMDRSGISGHLDVELPVEPLTGGLLSVSPDGSAVAVLALAPGEDFLQQDPADLGYTLTVVDLPSGRTRFSNTVHPGGNGSVLAWQPDGEVIVLASLDEGLSFVDADSGQARGDPVDLPYEVSALQFSPTGDVLMVADFSGALRPFDMATRRLGSAQEIVAGSFVTSMDRIPDTENFVVGVAVGQAYVAEFPTGRPISQPLQAGTGGVARVAVSPDGERLATVDNDQSLRLWDLASRRGIGPPLQGFFGAQGLAFLEGGRTVVSDSMSGTTFLELDPESWRAAACRLADRNLTPEEWTTYLPGEPYRRTC